jgi:carbamoyl-phosphate synthase small subunit
MEGLDLASGMSCTEPYDFTVRNVSLPLVAVYDFGVKLNILRLLEKSGFSVRVYPSKTPVEHVVHDGARGILLSNGPGDPDAIVYARDLVQDIIKCGIPTFGICLGHQIIGLGLGGRTYKLKFGHRGANHPVMNLLTNRVEISTQNHGFTVDFDSLKHDPDIEITHINLNDNTVEGLRHKKLPLFSVQYHPEAGPGPHDSRYLFEEFHKLVVG